MKTIEELEDEVDALKRAFKTILPRVLPDAVEHELVLKRLERGHVFSAADVEGARKIGPLPCPENKPFIPGGVASQGVRRVHLCKEAEDLFGEDSVQVAVLEYDFKTVGVFIDRHRESQALIDEHNNQSKKEIE